MSWTTAIWSMNAGICLALAGAHLLAWVKLRDAWVNLAFALCAASVASIAVFELLAMRAQTPVEWAHVLRWAHVPVAILVFSLVWFIRLYLQAGSAWLAGSIYAVRALVLIVNFASGANVNFSEITALRHVSLWGEQVTVPVGVPSSWDWLIRLSELLLLLFIVDAAIGAWRQGRQRQALVMGASLACTILVAATFSTLLTRGNLPTAMTVSMAFMILMVAMGYELSNELVRSRQLDRALQQNEERMRLAATAANLGLWEWDVRRDYIWLSAEGRALFGFSASEPADLERFYRAVHPDDREQVRQQLERALEGGSDYKVEHRVVRSDGERWVATRGRVGLGPDGKPLRMRGVSLDITEAKQADAELERQRAELSHIARVASLGQLTTALAHELNQPLTAILGNAEAARRFLTQGSADPDMLREILGDIIEDDVRAGEIIQRIRALVRREQSEHAAVAIADVIREVLLVIRNDAALQSVAIELELEASLPPVLGDRIQLQQVVLNLLLNALDAVKGSPEGEREVAVTSGERDEWVHVAVRDRGTGLDPEALENVFLPFYTTKPEGLGVGLSICRTIIQDHGGRLWAENNTDGGATFHFELPPADRGLELKDRVPRRSQRGVG